MLVLPLLITPKAVCLSVSIARKVLHRGKGSSSSLASLVSDDDASSTSSLKLKAYPGGGGMGSCAATADMLLRRCPDVADESREKFSLFRTALARMPTVKDAEGRLTTAGWEELCRLTLPVVESFGPAFGMVHRDISNNCERLRRRLGTDPVRFRHLYTVVLDEVARKDNDHGQSCTVGILWLKRGGEFLLRIMADLLRRPNDTMGAVVYDAYHATLHRWHGMLASSAFAVALAFMPSREVFLDRLTGGATGPQAMQEMALYVEKFTAIMNEVHAFLDKHGLDDPRKV